MMNPLLLGAGALALTGLAISALTRPERVTPSATKREDKRARGDGEREDKRARGDGARGESGVESARGVAPSLTLTTAPSDSYPPTEKLLRYIILCNNVGGALGDPSSDDGERRYKYRINRAKRAIKELKQGPVKTAEYAQISLAEYRREVWHVLRTSLSEGVNITGRSYDDLWGDTPPLADPLPGEVDRLAANYVDFINARRVVMRHAGAEALRLKRNPFDAMRAAGSKCRRLSHFIIDDWLLPLVAGEDRHLVYDARRYALDSGADVEVIHNAARDVWELWLIWPSSDGGYPLRERRYDTSLIKSWGFDSDIQRRIIAGNLYRRWVKVCRSRPTHEHVTWPWELAPPSPRWPWDPVAR